MTNALTIYEQFDTLQRAALALYKSGFFTDAKSEAQAIVKVMAGAELGLPPFASMTGIHIIQGKPALGANVIATLVKNDGRYNYRPIQHDQEVCMIEWFENGHKVGEAGFTMTEAKIAGLTNKENWKKYPSDMLFARAITRGARRFAPGIFGGSPIYTPDELGADTDEEGYIVDVTPEPASNGQPLTVEQINDDLFGPEHEPANSPDWDAIPDWESRLVDLLASLDEMTRPIVGTVVKLADETGLYNGQEHALNAILKWPEWGEKQDKVNPRTPLKVETAKRLLQWLVERKVAKAEGGSDD